MSLKLSTKEKMLLQDLKSHEELCVQKYEGYSKQAQDSNLSQLFTSIGKKEQEHLNTVSQILSGQTPNIQQSSGSQMGMGQSQGAGQGMGSQMGMGQSQGGVMGSSQMFNQGDKTLCSDMLSTEKFVSSAYNTAIFECTNTQVRQALNHIQKEEQEHGEQIFSYMQSNGMYSVQQGMQ